METDEVERLSGASDMRRQAQRLREIAARYKTPVSDRLDHIADAMDQLAKEIVDAVPKSEG